MDKARPYGPTHIFKASYGRRTQERYERTRHCVAVLRLALQRYYSSSIFGPGDPEERDLAAAEYEYRAAREALRRVEKLDKTGWN